MGGLAAVQCCGQLFALGGRDGTGAYLNSMEVYNADAAHWVEVPPMQIPRCWCGAAALGDYIYVVGGRNQQGPMRSVERYSLTRKMWERTAQLRMPRWCHAVVSLNGQIFAIGGYGVKDRLASMERFDPVREVWEEMTPMPGG